MAVFLKLYVAAPRDVVAVFISHYNLYKNDVLMILQVALVEKNTE